MDWFESDVATGVPSLRSKLETSFRFVVLSCAARRSLYRSLNLSLSEFFRSAPANWNCRDRRKSAEKAFTIGLVTPLRAPAHFAPRDTHVDLRRLALNLRPI